MTLSEDFAEKLKQFCLAHSEIAALYLFGSAGTGKARSSSDVDIAVIAMEPFSEYDRIDMETALSNLLGRDVDLVVFTRASPLLQHQILKYGRLICENDPKERVRQEVFARHEYLDSRHLHRELR